MRCSRAGCCSPSFSDMTPHPLALTGDLELPPLPRGWRANERVHGGAPLSVVGAVLSSVGRLAASWAAAAPQMPAAAPAPS